MATGAFRALFATSGERLFAVVGTGVYEIYSDKTCSDALAFLTTSSGRVSISENETQLIILDGTDGWIFTLATNTMERIVNQTDMVQFLAFSELNQGIGYVVGEMLTLPTPTNGTACTAEVTAVLDGKVITATVLSKGRGYIAGDYATTSNGQGTGAIATVTEADLADGGFNPGKHVVTLDGFFVKTANNSGQFQWSYLRDGLTWDTFDFATAEGTPDNLVAIGKVNNELWLFGNRTTEVWYDTGDRDAQFRRVQQGFIDIGCAAEWSVSALGNVVLWLGVNSQGGVGTVWMASGYVPQRVSTHAIEFQIAEIARTSKISDATAYTYQQEGHYFYVLSFPSGNKTFVYDLKENLWHERAHWNAEKGRYERHRSEVYAFWRGLHMVGDWKNTDLYELDLNTYTDNGAPIRRLRTGPHIRSDRKRLFFRKFELDVERGTGLNVYEYEPLRPGVGQNPHVVLRHSDDGGKTWSNGRTMDVGNLGEYLARCHAYRLGMSRDRVFQVYTSDPVKLVLVGARADIEAGRD